MSKTNIKQPRKKKPIEFGAAIYQKGDEFCSLNSTCLKNEYYWEDHDRIQIFYNILFSVQGAI